MNSKKIARKNIKKIVLQLLRDLHKHIIPLTKSLFFSSVEQYLNVELLVLLLESHFETNIGRPLIGVLSNFKASFTASCKIIS